MKKKILLIDDDKIFLDLFRCFLQSDGHEVLCCDDASQAMDLFQNESVEAAVIDYHLPGMNGAEITSKVRMLHPRMLIIGFSLDHKEQEFLSAGANTFYLKPLINEVISRINELS